MFREMVYEAEPSRGESPISKPGDCNGLNPIGVACPGPTQLEEKLADRISTEENLLPEGWKQQIGDEDLLHPEGRDCELDKLREAWDCDNCGEKVQDIINEDCMECWEDVSYEQLEHAR